MDISQHLLSLETDELKQSLHTRALELAYERTFLESRNIYNEEEARRFRVRILLLEDEKDDLHTQLAQSDQLVDQLEKNKIHTRNQLIMAEKSLEKVRLDQQAKSREIDLLKAELESSQSVASDSTKLLTEKLSLAREIASLKPEIEHLRSQTASHQSLLSEKLTLQRQLATVQVELETEKRTTQRMQAKEIRLKADDVKLETRIESLQAELAQERRQREQAEREAEKASADSESKKATFEFRLDAFRNKLRITKEQLKATQADLQNAQQTTNVVSRQSGTTGPEKDVGMMARKRTSAQLDADSMIGTPGFVPPSKKNKGGSTLPGDKSTFSITPFLNRATSVTLEDAAPEAGSSDKEDEISASFEPADVQGELIRPVVRGMPRTMGAIHEIENTRPTKRSGILKPNQLSKSSSRAPPKRNPKIPLSLEKVAEREEDNDAAETTKTRNGDSGTAPDISNEQLDDVKKKRRKLFGGDLAKTLFDDDDGVMIKDSTMSKGKSAFSAPKSRPRIGLASAKSSFGAISPLKKDKKSVGI
ncbi:hypothetical protein MMC29_004119 [Sticta canariensis]|nr:hypothetical protein [Sticta canariensis]